MQKLRFSFILVTVLIVFQSCSSHFIFRETYKDANALLTKVNRLDGIPFLKAHMKDGSVFILRDTWRVDTIDNSVTGNGTHFDFNREIISTGNFIITLDSVALFETNLKIVEPEESRIRGLTILAGLDIILGIYCLSNPKACFGSCPTFYQEGNEDFHSADAEGFSNAILPSMEYGDVDALDNPPLTGKTFSITMKNEALETHCVKAVKLLAYPRNTGERVFHTSQNEFVLCKNIYPLSSGFAEEGDITKLLSKRDRTERFSPADGKNLIAKEEIYLTFDNVGSTDSLGLILNFRQTLMTTFLIYSAMGYMGDEAVDLLADVENQKFSGNSNAHIKTELGEIEIYIWDETATEWKLQNTLYETGPIAINRQIVSLNGTTSGDRVKLKLIVNKGLWRFDYAALTNIKGKVAPVELSPDNLLNKGLPDEAAFSNLIDSEKYLLSMPGSEYKLSFTLPDAGHDYELFIYSKGYYLIWMRQNWYQQKNLSALQMMIYEPAKYLKSVTDEYKRYEKTMEADFWNSRINTKKFSYYEN